MMIFNGWLELFALCISRTCRCPTVVFILLFALVLNCMWYLCAAGASFMENESKK